MARSDPKSTYLDPAISRYLLEHTSPPDPLLEELAEETRRVAPEWTSMPIDPDQGLLLTLLTQMLRPKRALEVGTFTGYSSICFARGLPPDGTLLCLDVSEEWTAVARKYWAKAGLAHQIELRLGPALDTLRSMRAEETFDLAFIDADKGNYPNYYQEILPRMHPGGVILVDNVLWSGRILQEEPDNPSTAVMKAFNDMVTADPRVTSIMLPIADGLTLIRKNP